jgi:integrase
MKICLKVMFYLGLRTQEVVELKRTDFSNDFLSLSYFPKKKKIRTIKIRAVPAFLAQELRKYYFRYHHRILENYLFFASYGSTSEHNHLTTNTIRDKFKQIRRQLKIKDVYYTCVDGKQLYRLSPHTMRHYFIWKIYQSSGNCLITARDIIGHIKAETTAKYCFSNNTTNKEREIIEKAFSSCP